MSLTKRRFLSVIVGVVGGAAVASAALCALHFFSNAESLNAGAGANSVAVSSTDLPVLFDVPKFGYPDQDGKLLTEQDLKGTTWICDFFYTRCTTICPLLTARLMLLQRSIRNPNVKFVSFSVDPSYDTSAVLKAYAAEWHGDESRWRLLATGTEDAVQATASSMHLALQRLSDPKNPILHSDRFLLYDAAGQARGAYESTDPDAMAQLVKDANKLANGGQPELLQTTDTTAAGDSQSSSVSGGRQLFMTMGCVACHSRPAVAPPLEGVAGSEVTLSDGRTVLADDAYLRKCITDPNAKVLMGYSPVMPNYRPYLSDAQIDGIVAYIKSLASMRPAVNTGPRVLVIDPVCGMQVSAGSDTPNVTYAGKTYYFCSETCREKFQADPARFARN